MLVLRVIYEDPPVAPEVDQALDQVVLPGPARVPRELHLYSSASGHYGMDFRLFK